MKEKLKLILTKSGNLMLEELNVRVVYLTKDSVELLDHPHSTFKDMLHYWGCQCRMESQHDVIERSWYGCPGSLS